MVGLNSGNEQAGLDIVISTTGSAKNRRKDTLSRLKFFVVKLSSNWNILTVNFFPIFSPPGMVNGLPYNLALPEQVLLFGHYISVREDF